MKALYASETPGGAALGGGDEQLVKLGRWDVLVCHDPQRATQGRQVFRRPLQQRCYVLTAPLTILPSILTRRRMQETSRLLLLLGK